MAAHFSDREGFTMNAPALPLLALALAAGIFLALPALKETALPHARRRLLALLIGVSITGGGYALYTLLGAAAWVDAIDTQRTRHQTVRSEIATLREHAAQHPDDLDALRRLSGLWIEAGNPAQASETLRQAVLQSGGQPDIIAEYAAALVLKNNGIVDTQAADSIDMALKLNPDQPLAKELDALRTRQKPPAPKEE